MAEPTGFEPATSDVTGRRSNQLNYDSALTCQFGAVCDYGASNGGLYILAWPKVHQISMISVSSPLAARLALQSRKAV